MVQQIYHLVQFKIKKQSPAANLSSTRAIVVMESIYKKSFFFSFLVMKRKEIVVIAESDFSFMTARKTCMNHEANERSGLDFKGSAESQTQPFQIDHING